MKDRLIGFLRKDRWFFSQADLAARGPFIVSDCPDGRMATSILGVLNGLLRFLGIIIFVRIETETGRGLGFGLSRRRGWF